MSPQKDLVIAYRIYPGVSKTPCRFPNSKLELAEFCLESLKNALHGVRFKIIAILDGCPDVYVDMFRRHFAADELDIRRVDLRSNARTFELQIDALLAQEESDYVMFAEDDYFYVPGSFRELLDFMKSRPDADFVTAYDHNDYYSIPLHAGPKTVSVNGRRHWMRVGATCLTFLTRRRTLKETQSVFRTYVAGNFDASLWMILTHSGASPLAAFRYLRDRLLLYAWCKAWWFGGLRLLFGKRYQLWCPLPGLATHMEASTLLMIPDWNSMMDAQIEGFERRPHMDRSNV
jgi:hypothetical protein